MPIGTGAAFFLVTVTDLRAKLAAVAVILGILAATGGAVFAQDRHPVCALKQHDCGTPATIAKCCCGDAAAPQDSGTPARTRVDARPDAAVALASVAAAHAAVIPHVSTAVDTSPPHWCLLDRPTLFGVLLI